MAGQSAPAESLVRAHDIGPAGSVVVAVEVDDVRVRGVDGTTVRLVAPATDHPAIEVAAGPGRYAVRLAHPVRGRVFGFLAAACAAVLAAFMIKGLFFIRRGAT